MKRSEMIKIISDVLYNTRDKELDYNLDDPWAEKLLSVLESYGMSPPDDDNVVYGWNEGWIEPPEWEKEDE